MVGTATRGYESMEGEYLFHCVVVDGCWGELCGA